MDETTLQQVAQQLRKPEGDMGKQVGERMNTGNRDMNLIAIEQLAVAPGDTILEIGMGNGAFVSNILSACDNTSYCGCDYSALMIDESIERNRQFIEQGRAKFIQATADSLPFDGGSFNKVFTVNTIYFWDDPATELAEIRRVLQPGGRFIIAIRPKEVAEHMPFTRFGFTLYSRAGLTELLETNDFRVTNVIEHNEPDQEFAGTKIRSASLIISTESVD